MPSYSFIIKEIVQETPDIRSFILNPEQSFEYKPGQFLTIVRGDVRRSFSFSSHPSDKFPKITLKRIPNGEISRWLFDDVKAGDRIHTIEASGLFVYPEDTSDYDLAVFMAAGSGITPVISMIREALSRNDNMKIMLLYSNRSKTHTVFHDELVALQKKHADRFTIHFFFSDSFNLARARMGRLALEEILSKTMKDPVRTIFFLCGPHVYMQNIEITLLTEGVPDDNIRREVFFNPDPFVPNVPPDMDMHTVNVNYQGKTHSLKVQFPKTILQTAKEQGILLPYSCEAGRCGTCASTCTRGEIWMSRNEVLLDKEMAKGRVLTCTGYAIGGDADITVTG